MGHTALGVQGRAALGVQEYGAQETQQGAHVGWQTRSAAGKRRGLQGKFAKGEHMKVAKLDFDEAVAIVLSTLLSQGIMLVWGVVVSTILAGVTSGDWLGAVVGLGWAPLVEQSVRALPTSITLGGAVLFAGALFAVAFILEKRAIAKRGVEEMIPIRRGIDGEVPRMPFPVLVVLMGIVGCVEELLFRFALLGLCIAMLSSVVPYFASVAISSVISSVLFVLAHAQYADMGQKMNTFFLGVAFCAVYLYSDSIALVAVAHALYNLAVLAYKRYQMNSDPDYFGGPAPTRVLMSEEEGEGA